MKSKNRTSARCDNAARGHLAEMLSAESTAFGGRMKNERYLKEDSRDVKS